MIVFFAIVVIFLSCLLDMAIEDRDIRLTAWAGLGLGVNLSIALYLVFK